MEKRRFGRTNHQSSVAIFGAAAFWDVTQKQADDCMQLVLSYGVNHIDVAPSYGTAELRLGPWMKTNRSDFFLGCKTLERTRDGVLAELERSLERLQTDHLDLYQLHCVSTWADLDHVFEAQGALHALIEAREQGICDYAGITVHGLEAPAIILEALRHFDFDTVLFPFNPVMCSDPQYRQDAADLLHQCSQKDIGVFTIKVGAHSPWGEITRTHTTWYQPITQPGAVQSAVDFALSHPIAGICTPGDLKVLPDYLNACENHVKMDDASIKTLITQTRPEQQIFK